MTASQGWRTFGLTRNPFRDVLDTDLLFRTGQHEEALVKLRLGIEDRHALLLLSGVSGTGKTLISQAVLRGLDPERFVPALVLAYPGMGKGQLLESILRELVLGDGGRYVHDRLQRLQDAVMAFHPKGRHLVVIIDEAHFLQADALHILRTLSNLETETQKLVTVLLVAEEALGRRLRAPSYASLRSRLVFAVRLEPLSLAETEQYVKYRLLKCGGRADLLPQSVYARLHSLSGGLPRQINRLLYNGFMEAMARDRYALSPEGLEEVATRMGAALG